MKKVIFIFFALIVAGCQDPDVFEPQVSEGSVKLPDPPVFTTSVVFDPLSLLTRELNKQTEITIKERRSDGTILSGKPLLESSDESVAKTDQNKITVVDYGEALVKASYTDLNENEHTVTITVLAVEPSRLPAVPVIYPKEAMVFVEEEISWITSRSYHPQEKSFSVKVKDENENLLATGDFTEIPEKPGTLTRFIHLEDEDGFVSTGWAQVTVKEKPKEPEEPKVIEKVFFFENVYLASHREEHLKKDLGNFSVAGHSFDLKGIHALDPSLSQYLNCWGWDETDKSANSVHFTGIRIRVKGNEAKIWLYAGYSGNAQRNEAFATLVNKELLWPSSHCPVLPDMDNGPPPDSGHRWQWVYIGKASF